MHTKLRWAMNIPSEAQTEVSARVSQRLCSTCCSNVEPQTWRVVKWWRQTLRRTKDACAVRWLECVAVRERMCGAGCGNALWQWCDAGCASCGRGKAGDGHGRRTAVDR